MNEISGSDQPSVSIDRWSWIAILAVWLFLCGDLMTGTQVVGYRDSGYLYYPLFKAVGEVWADGKLPLWNPYCNYGFPTVADGSSSVFYPGKVVFALSFLPYPSRYGIYLSLHLLVAAFGAWQMAKTLNARPAGRTLAGLAFAFGAPVLFQVTNPIYLVSAAWLPWALREVWLLLHGRPYRHAVLGGVFCALMILGGDPQMVYHVGLIFAASILGGAVFRGWKSFRHGVSDDDPPAWRWAGRRVAPLVVMALVTSSLAAVQLVPTWELSQRSERATPQSGVGNIYGMIAQHLGLRGARSNAIPIQKWLATEDQIVGQYQFSQPPWSLVELALPNVSGKPFPRNSRWVDSLPAADRMWFPSLYVGLLVLLLAARCAGCRRSDRRVVWLTWITLAFTLGSFGWYGGAWLWREVTALLGAGGSSGDQWAAPVGGIYWWMTTLLPKYYIFRYPAKLFIVAALGLSLLAGIELERLERRTQFLPWQLAAGSLAMTIAAMLIIEWLIRPAILGLPSNGGEGLWSVAVSEFGPLDYGRAVDQLYVALLHIGLLLLAVAIWSASCRAYSGKRRGFLTGVVWICAFELVIANGWLLAKVPASAMEQRFEHAMQGKLNPENQLIPVLPAMQDDHRFQDTVSDQRLSELIRRDRAWLAPKHHLSDRVRVLGSFHSIWPTGYYQLVDTARRMPGQWRNGLPDQESTYSILKSSIDWNHVKLTLSVDEPGWQELPVWGDRWWQVECLQEAEGLNQPVVTTRRVSANDLLELELPRGRFQISLDYRPTHLWTALVISLISWCLTVGWLLRSGHHSGLNPAGGSSSPGATGG